MLAHVSAYTILEGLRRQVAHKLMHAPLGSVLSKPVGSLKSTIVDRIEDIEPPLAHMIPELSSNVLLPIVVVIALFAMDWRMGLASLATIPAALIPMAASLRTYNEKYAAYMAANAQVNSIIVEYSLIAGQREACHQLRHSLHILGRNTQSIQCFLHIAGVTILVILQFL